MTVCVHTVHTFPHGQYTQPHDGHDCITTTVCLLSHGGAVNRIVEFILISWHWHLIPQIVRVISCTSCLQRIFWQRKSCGLGRWSGLASSTLLINTIMQLEDGDKRLPSWYCLIWECGLSRPETHYLFSTLIHPFQPRLRGRYHTAIKATIKPIKEQSGKRGSEGGAVGGWGSVEM